MFMLWKFKNRCKNWFFKQLKFKMCITTKTCTQIQNFKSNFLKNYNDSEFTVKTKNAPFFMNYPNIYKLWQLLPTGLVLSKKPKFRCCRIRVDYWNSQRLLCEDQLTRNPFYRVCFDCYQRFDLYSILVLIHFLVVIFGHFSLSWPYSFS